METAAETLIEMVILLLGEMAAVGACGRVLAKLIVARQNSVLSNEILDEGISGGEIMFEEVTILSARNMGFFSRVVC